MRNILLAGMFAVGALALGGCGGTSTLSALESASTAGATIASAVVPGAAPILTATALAACAAQQVANAIGSLAQSQGNTAVAGYASQTSKVMGVACTW